MNSEMIRTKHPGLLKLWKYTQINLGKDCRNKRIIGLKKDPPETLKVHLFETVAMETDQKLVHVIKIELFYHLLGNF